MNILRQLNRLRELLKKERAHTRAAREALKLSRQREKALRAESARLSSRLHDLGVGAAPAPITRRGYRTVDAECRARMHALKGEGKNNSQISRLLGCSPATVSLVVRGKYPAVAQNRPGPPNAASPPNL